MKDIEQISQELDLSKPFIRKCLNRINLLKPYIHKGEHNKTLFDKDGLPVFLKIKELKLEGLSIPAIKNRLNDPIQTGVQTENVKSGNVPIQTEILPTPVSVQSVKSEPPVGQAELFRHYENELSALRQDRKELEQHVHDLTDKAARLSGQLKALPGGKSPEEVTMDYEREAYRKQELARLWGEYQGLNAFQWRKRKQLKAQIDKLIMEKPT